MGGDIWITHQYHNNKDNGNSFKSKNYENYNELI
jgi:hypothetical protein